MKGETEKELTFVEAVKEIHQEMTDLTGKLMYAVEENEKEVMCMLVTSDEMMPPGAKRFKEWVCDECGTTLQEGFIHCWRCLQFGYLKLHPTLEKTVDKHKRMIQQMMKSTAKKIENAITAMRKAVQNEQGDS